MALALLFDPSSMLQGAARTTWIYQESPLPLALKITSGLPAATCLAYVRSPWKQEAARFWKQNTKISTHRSERTATCQDYKYPVGNRKSPVRVDPVSLDCSHPSRVVVSSFFCYSKWRTKRRLATIRYRLRIRMPRRAPPAEDRARRARPCRS